MKEFIFRMLTRVLFGPGVVNVAGAECKKLGATRVFVLTGPNVVKTPAFAKVQESVMREGLAMQIFSDIEADSSIETIDHVARVMQQFQADLAGFPSKISPPLWQTR